MVGVKEEGGSEVAYERGERREGGREGEREREKREIERWNECVCMYVLPLVRQYWQKEGQCFVKGDGKA